MTARHPSAATVLLVDDDPVVATMYGLGLERAGYKVVVANDGHTGLELVSKAKPDLILLDIRMPVLDGIEVLKRLAADGVTQRTPVVMLSNSKEAGVMERAISLGAKEYLVKLEITPREVAAVVGRWLSSAGSQA
jgi:CheY-like chemotaxis protein